MNRARETSNVEDLDLYLYRGERRCEVVDISRPVTGYAIILGLVALAFVTACIRGCLL